jgi:hypothetical protein
MVKGSCLISGSCLTSGELSGSRFIRFELRGSARAVLQSAQLLFSLPWGQGVHTTQSHFTFPWGQGLHAAHLRFSFP